MKVLVAYDSGNGTVKTAVDYMLKSLSNLDVTTAALTESVPDPNEFDIVVVGASVRFGKLRKAARKFLKEQEHILVQKKLGLFFCCGLTEEQDYYAKKLFAKSLADTAFQISFFGGSLNTEGLSFLDKRLVKAMRSSLFERELDDGNYVPNLPYILPENIDNMANAIQAVATGTK
ncbi:MAG: hypothetical protein E7637_00010 [Ruminococcaceae bacterium]|nr:hypothetical protein [Oscillospiraceae bacterium]